MLHKEQSLPYRNTLLKIKITDILYKPVIVERDYQ